MFFAVFLAGLVVRCLFLLFCSFGGTATGVHVAVPTQRREPSEGLEKAFDRAVVFRLPVELQVLLPSAAQDALQRGRVATPVPRL